MPDWLHTDDINFDRIPLGPFDTRLWWLLIGVCLVLVFTIQAIETAIEGAWPNQRRPDRMLPRARWVQASWAFVALFVLAGALLTIANVAILIWKNPPHPSELGLGSVLLAIGWALFLLFSLNALGLGRLMGTLGLIGPLAIVTILIVGDILLLITFQHLFPSAKEVRDGIEHGLKEILPFWD